MHLLDRSLQKQRPILINILVILLLLGSFMGMKSIIDAAESGHTILWYYYFSIAITILSFSVAIGLLMMKRLAVYTYIIYIPISLYTQYYVSGVFNIFSVIFATLFIAIMVKYLKEME